MRLIIILLILINPPKIHAGILNNVLGACGLKSIKQTLGDGVRSVTSVLDSIKRPKSIDEFKNFAPDNAYVSNYDSFSTYLWKNQSQSADYYLNITKESTGAPAISFSVTKLDDAFEVDTAIAEINKIVPDARFQFTQTLTREGKDKYTFRLKNVGEATDEELEFMNFIVQQLLEPGNQKYTSFIKRQYDLFLASPEVKAIVSLVADYTNSYSLKFELKRIMPDASEIIDDPKQWQEVVDGMTDLLIESAARYDFYEISAVNKFYLVVDYINWKKAGSIPTDNPFDKFFKRFVKGKAYFESHIKPNYIFDYSSIRDKFARKMQTLKKFEKYSLDELRNHVDSGLYLRLQQDIDHIHNQSGMEHALEQFVVQYIYTRGEISFFWSDGKLVDIGLLLPR